MWSSLVRSRPKARGEPPRALRPNVTVEEVRASAASALSPTRQVTVAVISAARGRASGRPRIPRPFSSCSESSCSLLRTASRRSLFPGAARCLRWTACVPSEDRWSAASGLLQPGLEWHRARAYLRGGGLMASRERRDPYIVLGVPRQASGEEIARAYRRAARASHPDSGGAGSTERFQAVSDAYEVLRDPRRRAVCDRSHPFAESRTAEARGSVRYAAPGSQHV